MPNSDSLPSDRAARAVDLIERMGRLLRASDHASGLNPAQAEALRYLLRANRFSRTPAALAEYLGSTRGTVSQTLLALEAKGWPVGRANVDGGRTGISARK
jgi:DNA-binding MarR family transcriptional regulator